MNYKNSNKYNILIVYVLVCFVFVVYKKLKIVDSLFTSNLKLFVSTL